VRGLGGPVVDTLPPPLICVRLVLLKAPEPTQPPGGGADLGRNWRYTRTQGVPGVVGAPPLGGRAAVLICGGMMHDYDDDEEEAAAGARKGDPRESWESDGSEKEGQVEEGVVLALPV